MLSRGDCGFILCAVGTAGLAVEFHYWPVLAVFIVFGSFLVFMSNHASDS